MQVESVYFKNDREQTIYEEGVRFGLTRDLAGVTNDVLTEREAWVFSQGILIATPEKHTPKKMSEKTTDEKRADWTDGYDDGALYAQTREMTGPDKIMNPSQIAGWIRGYEDNK